MLLFCCTFFSQLDDDSEESDDEETQDKDDGGAKLYKPPKLVAMHYGTHKLSITLINFIIWGFFI